MSFQKIDEKNKKKKKEQRPTTQNSQMAATQEEVVRGFKINWMNLRDADSGKIIWEAKDWADALTASGKQAHIPKHILKCKSVSREIDFSSVHLIQHFRVVQSVFVHGQQVESFHFDFGFVIPGSTNTWQNIIEADEEGGMIPPEVLSGNTVIETSFFDGQNLVNRSKVTLFYV
ncbi:phosphodiesterase 6D cGMPspecific [Obelidium mucronatum]|nr:phosphodiesterase 6D cGMPspecific [Obelidium mucronatum]